MAKRSKRQKRYDARRRVQVAQRQDRAAAAAVYVVSRESGVMLTTKAVVRSLLVVSVVSVLSLILWTFLPLCAGWKPMLITSGSMQPWVRAGDVVLVDPAPASKLRDGDVATYRATDADELITHRFVHRNSDGLYSFKGDANQTFDTQPVPASAIVGKVRLVVPLVGQIALQGRRSLLLSVVGVIFVTVTTIFAIGRNGSGNDGGLPRGRKARRVAAVSLAVAVMATTATSGQSAAAFSGLAPNGSNSLATGSFYKSTVLAASPVAYWRLGEASGATSGVDQRGTANLSYVNAPQLGATGVLAHDTDKAMTGTGTQYAKTAANVAALTLTSAISVEAWIKPSGTQVNTARIVSKYDGANINYLLAYDNPPTKMRFLVDTTTTRYIAYSTTLLTNTAHWYHLVGTWDGSAVRIYVDGVLEATTATAGTIKTNTYAVGVGAQDTGASAFKGTVDEVAIYPTVLSQATITNHYQLATT